MTIRLILTTLLFSTSLFITSLAFAGPARDGFTLGLQAGFSKVSIPSGIPATITNGTDLPFTLRETSSGRGLSETGYFGYLWALGSSTLVGGQLGFDRNGSASHFYTGVGLFSVHSFNINISSYDFSEMLVFQQYFDPEWSFTVKAGAAEVAQKQTLTDFGALSVFWIYFPGGMSQTTVHKTRPVASASLNYHLDENIAFHVEARRLFGEDLQDYSNSKIATATDILFGVDYQF